MFSPTVLEIKFDPYILVAQMFQKLELAIGSFRENWGAERLHDLFDCHGLTGQLIFCRTEQKLSTKGGKQVTEEFLPDQSKSSHAHWLQVGVPAYLSTMGALMMPAMAGTIFDLPAGYLKRCTKNLGTYEFCHAGEDRMHSVGK